MMNLTKFCSGQDDPREYLRQPMRTAEGIAYTNGHVLVVVPDDGKEYQPAPESVANIIQRMISEHQGCGLWIKMADVDLPGATPCGYCNGSGVVSYEFCSDCDGDGEFLHGSHYYTCKECDGEGGFKSMYGGHEVTCQGCGGHKEEPTAVSILGVTFQRRYLAMLAELPDCQISPSDMTKAAPFRFVGGRGILMPYRT